MNKEKHQIASLKNKIDDINIKISTLTEKLKKLQKLQKQLINKLKDIADDDKEFSEFYSKADEARIQENMIEYHEKPISELDPRLEASAQKAYKKMAKEFDETCKQFDKEEDDVQDMEEKGLSIEKELPEITKEIIKTENKIESLLMESSKLTSRLQSEYGVVL